MTTGHVKWYSDEKGYGFIQVEGRDDIFVHYSDIGEEFRTLEEGLQVQFDIESGPKGERARRVTKAEAQ